MHFDGVALLDPAPALTFLTGPETKSASSRRSYQVRSTDRIVAPVQKVSWLPCHAVSYV